MGWFSEYIDLSFRANVKLILGTNNPVQIGHCDAIEGIRFQVTARAPIEDVRLIQSALLAIIPPDWISMGGDWSHWYFIRLDTLLGQLQHETQQPEEQPRPVTFEPATVEETFRAADQMRELADAVDDAAQAAFVEAMVWYLENIR